MKSFFKELAHVESCVLGDTSYITTSGDRKPYSDKTVETVEMLIGFVESGNFTKAKCSKFIGKHFRYSPEALTSQWNKEFGADKSQNTMRSQISVTSTVLYKIFGDDFAEQLIKDEPDGVSSILSCIEIGELMFDDIFMYDVVDTIEKSYDKAQYDIAELKNEISVLQGYRRDVWNKQFSRLDMSKLAYIKRVLDKPLVVDHAVNQTKLGLLKVFNQLPVKSDKPIRGMQASSRTAQDIILGDEHFKNIVSCLEKSTDTENPAHVEELISILYVIATKEGCKKYFSKFNAKEFALALKRIKTGN